MSTQRSKKYIIGRKHEEDSKLRSLEAKKDDDFEVITRFERIISQVSLNLQLLGKFWDPQECQH